MTKKIMDAYPKAILCSNIEIKEINNLKIQFHDIEDIDNIKNGEQGVLFFIDEIQNYLNSLQSKQIPLSTIVQLTQMRKQRKLIIGTSQVYSRMAKPLREQVRNVVLCKNFLSILQFNQLIDSIETKEGSDGQLKPVVQKRFFFFHSPKLYKLYDTYKLSMKPKNNDNNIIIDNNNYIEM